MIKFLARICLTFLIFPTLFWFNGVWAAETDLTLSLGHSGVEIKSAQITLNLDPATKLASTGAGSPGQETNYFGNRTRLAIIKFQRKYGVIGETGRIGPQTRRLLVYLGPKLVKAKNNRTPIIPTDWPEAGARTRAPAISTNYPSSISVKKLVEVKLSSLSPTTITAGGTITIYGAGFTRTGNNIETKYKTISNVSSSDGKTLTFSLSLPAGDIALSGLNQFSAAIVSSVIVPIPLRVVNGNGSSNELIFNYQIK